MPTYQPTACLNATYSHQFTSLGGVVETYIPSEAIHQKLYHDEQAYRKNYTQTATLPTAINTMQASCNIALGNITLLYSEVDASEGLPEKLEKISLPIINHSDLYHVSFPMVKLYSENTIELRNVRGGLRDIDFNEQLKTHLNTAKLYYPYDELPLKERTGLKKNIEEAIPMGDFQQAFHHCEQGLMCTCLSTRFMDEIIQKLEEKDAHTFGGVVIDIFSSRLMCNNCAYHLAGFSHHYSAVLMDKINASELTVDFPMEDAVLVHPRVSAEKKCKTNDGSTIELSHDQNSQHKYGVNEQPITLQSTVRKMQLHSYEGKKFSTYSDFFLSSDIRREEVETAIKDSRRKSIRQ